MCSPYHVRQISFDEDSDRPCVKERWLGPRPSVLGYEDDEEDDDDDDERDREAKKEDVVDDDEGDKEDKEEDEGKGRFLVEVAGPEQNITRDSRASHPLLKIFSRIRQYVLGFLQDWWKPCEAERTPNI